MDIPIVFEDEVMIVINKPAGVVVNRADTTAKIETVQDWIERRTGGKEKDEEMAGDESEIEKEFKSRGGIVHRLDKDTSGVLVIAKTVAAFENLKNQFKDRKTIKKYSVLVHGKMQSARGRVEAPIERSPFNRMHFGVFPGGREALTEYCTVGNYELPTQNLGQNALSLLEVTPHTGRTHQIRVHMKHLGHAVVSDPIYGGRKQIREDLKWCPRLFLHAAKLEIEHPLSGKKSVFEARLPDELKGVLQTLVVVD